MTRGKRLSPEKRQQILAEALKPGSSISMIARHNNMSPKTLGTWKRKYLSKNTQNTEGKFVELEVKEVDSSVLLNKASLDFKDFAFSITGKVRSSSLIKIIKILEGSKCSQ